jgi:signal peptidase
MRKLINWTGNMLLALGILAMAFFFLAPHFLGINFFTVYGGSMMPAIPIGSVVAVKSVEVSTIKVGDIIAFRAGTEANKVVTHRVVEVSIEDGALSFHTAGDSNTNPDGNAVPAQNVVGSVWFYVPFLGYLSSFIITKLGFVLLVLLPGILVDVMEVRNIIAEIRSMRKVTGTGIR